MRGVLLVMLMIGFSATGAVCAENATVKPAISVTDAAQLPAESFPWGTLKWLCNAKLFPGAQQTVGLATTLPGQRNPVHFHPNCEEVLHVISGRGTHSVEGQTVELKAGMTIRIPAGMKHNLVNTGAEPLVTLISFSSGDRKTVFLEDKPAK